MIFLSIKIKEKIYKKYTKSINIIVSCVLLLFYYIFSTINGKEIHKLERKYLYIPTNFLKNFILEKIDSFVEKNMCKIRGVTRRKNKRILFFGD